MKITVDKIDTFEAEDGTYIVRGRGNVSILSTDKDEVWIMERLNEGTFEWMKKQKAMIDKASLN